MKGGKQSSRICEPINQKAGTQVIDRCVELVLPILKVRDCPAILSFARQSVIYVAGWTPEKEDIGYRFVRAVTLKAKTNPVNIVEVPFD